MLAVKGAHHIFMSSTKKLLFPGLGKMGFPKQGITVIIIARKV